MVEGPDATWGNLIELLIDCEQTVLAEQVKDALGLQRTIVDVIVPVPVINHIIL